MTEGVAAGTVVGAIVGHIVGKRDGAIAGAVIGGAAGGLVGTRVADKKQRYAEREAALRASAEQSKSVAQQARATNAALQRDIRDLQVSVARLERERMSARSHNDLARSTRRSFNKTVQRLDQQLVAVREELARQTELVRQEQALAQQTNERSPQSAIRNVNLGIEDLRDRERALERARAQLQQLDSRRAF